MDVHTSDPNSPRNPQTRPSQSNRTRLTQSPRTPRSPRLPTSTSSTSEPSTSNTNTYTTTSSSSTISSRTSLSSLRGSLSQNPHIYDISEIRAATNNFLAKRHSSSTSSSTPCWRCTLRNADTIIFQRKFRRKIDTSQLKHRLSVLCRSHHLSVIKLLGVCISRDHIYLVYEFVKGSNLADLLRNKRNPNFTVLSAWMSRMQIAADLAHGLDYIHNKTGLNVSLVQNRINSSSVIVTEPSFNAKICHFGTAQLCGEAEESDIGGDDDGKGKELKRSGDSGEMQFEGVRGYMSPEFRATGIPTQKSDVYAFGVVVLELLSGKEPYKFRYDKNTGDYVRTSVIDTARAVIDGGGDDDGDGGSRVREGRLREWVDRRLKDSFPVEVAEKLTRVALECVDVDPDKRPEMGRVAGKISRWYLESSNWYDKTRISDQISVSLAPR